MQCTTQHPGLRFLSTAPQSRDLRLVLQDRQVQLRGWCGNHSPANRRSITMPINSRKSASSRTAVISAIVAV